MPKLKHLLCSIEHADSNIPFREYGTSYGDGFVETHVVVPPTPVPFTLHLSSTSYIAPGIAMFVFMDGTYQCNRNIDGLVPPSEATDTSQSEVEFRVRQKEQMLNDDTWIGREWRFEEFNVVNGETCAQPHALSPSVAHLASLGLIEVVVLRCLNSADSMTAPLLHTPPTAPDSSGKLQTPKPELSPPSLGGLFFDGAGDPYPPKHTCFRCDGIEDQSTRSESKTVRFGGGGGRCYSCTEPGTRMRHVMNGSYDPNSFRGVFRPEETWGQRTQAYEHYGKERRTLNDKYDEFQAQNTPQCDRSHCCHGRQTSPKQSHARLPTTNNWRQVPRPEDGGRTQCLDPHPTSRGHPPYHPCGLGPPTLQSYNYGNQYPASEVEVSTRTHNNHRYNIQDQCERSGYLDMNGDWVGSGAGDSGLARASDCFLEPRPREPSSIPRGEPADPRCRKLSPEYIGGTNIDGARAMPQEAGDGIRKQRSFGNNGKAKVYPDANNSVSFAGGGTWKPRDANTTNMYTANRGDISALEHPTVRADSDIAYLGQGIFTMPNSGIQPGARLQDPAQDANLSYQGGERNAHSGREGTGISDYGKLYHRNNSDTQISRANDNTSKRGGNKPYERGCDERNQNGDREVNSRGNRNGSRTSGADGNTSRRGSRSNERSDTNRIDENCNRGRQNEGNHSQRSNRNESRISRFNEDVSIQKAESSQCVYHDINWDGRQENDDHHNQLSNQNGARDRANASAPGSGRANSNECGYIEDWRNDNRPSNGRTGWNGGDEHTTHWSTSQIIIDNGERGSKGFPSKEGDTRGGGSTHGNRQDADQGHRKSQVGNGCSGGNDEPFNRSRSRGRSCGDGKSDNGGSRWGGSMRNPAKLESDINNPPASGNQTRSGRGGNEASYEIGNAQGGEGLGWSCENTAQGQEVLNGDNGDDIWNSNTGENWGSGNDNEGGYLSGPGGNGNADNWGDGNGEFREDAGNNGEWGGKSTENPKPDTTNGDWGGGGDNNIGEDNAYFSEFNNGANDSGGAAYKADEINNWKEPTASSTSNRQIQMEVVASPIISSADHTVPYTKSYWSSWMAESEPAMSPTQPNTSRKRTDSFHSGEELPLYSIHKDQLTNHSARHQVRHGRPEYYARHWRKPVYLDSMAEPYAVFVFKYRPKQALELLLKIPIDDDEEYEKSRLMRLSKDEIIEELLQMKLKASASSNPTRDNGKASEENRVNALVDKEGVGEPGDGGW